MLKAKTIIFHITLIFKKIHTQYLSKEKRENLIHPNIKFTHWDIFHQLTIKADTNLRSPLIGSQHSIVIPLSSSKTQALLSKGKPWHNEANVVHTKIRRQKDFIRSRFPNTE